MKIMIKSVMAIMLCCMLAGNALADLTDGLVAYYPFNGNANDETGNGYNGLVNGATLSEDRFGTANSAYFFDGRDDHIQASININPDVMPEVTMTAWVKADDYSRPDSRAPIRQIVSHDNGGYDRSFGIDNRVPGYGTGWSAFTGNMCNGSGAQEETLGQFQVEHEIACVLGGYHPVVEGEWVFLAVVYDQSSETARLYVNCATPSMQGSCLGEGWDYILIGSSPSYGEYFFGIIDEVRIYDRVLSPSEIGELFACGQAMAIPTLHIQANGSDGPVTIPTEGDTSLSVALDCGSMTGLDADWWLGAQTPSGWYYFDVAQGTWMPGTSFLIWQGPLFSFSNVELPGSISLPEGSSTFYFVIDTNMNGLLDADLYYDSVVVISQSETYSTDLTGTYIGSLDATTTECFPEEEDDAFTLSGSITITSPSQVGEMFSASGELMIHRFGFDFTLNISISGTVTAEGELSGTYTETFVGTNGFYSSGNGTFTGSVADNALSIQIVGTDTDVFGVTCVTRGTFTGSR